MITCLHYKAPVATQNRTLLIMLPGAGIEAAEFAEQGMVAAIHSRRLAVDVVATRPDLDLYLDGGITAALHRTVIEPARAEGYEHIWLLGISLGGMGALLYTSVHAAEIEGVVLLAPFLGTRGTVAEIAKAGGLASWNAAQSIATDTERQLLVWLQNFLERPPASPLLYLGYGKDDRFAPGHRMLEERLPADYAVTIAGGHDWETWLELWQRVLDIAPFMGCTSRDPAGQLDDAVQQCLSSADEGDAPH